MVRCVLLLALCALGPVREVGAVPRREQAEELLRQGNLLYDRGEHLPALARYRAARDLYPSFKIDFNIAITLEAMGRVLEAAEQLERFLSRSAVADRAIVASAQRRLRKLRGRLGSVEVRCPVAGATIWVDGAAVGRVPLENRIYLRPGSYRLEVRAPGGGSYQRRISLEAGEHLPLLASLLWSATSRPTAQSSPPPPARVARPLHQRWWLWTAVGAVVIGGVVGAIVGTRSARGDPRVPVGELGTLP